ncbi:MULTISPECIES: hypothetical protein [Cellulomonas]|uniref:DUF7878 domain-containing protein n=1 Tax=Cellulomonas sp. TaxID=40001 RepID=UPI0010A8DE1E|nr:MULTISPECIES: hypothetical protein [Cellulomonas]
MDTVEEDLLWLRRADDGTWSVGSPWGEAVVQGVPSAEVVAAVRRYVAEVDRWLHEQLGWDASGRPTRA